MEWKGHGTILNDRGGELWDGQGEGSELTEMPFWVSRNYSRGFMSISIIIFAEEKQQIS